MRSRILLLALCAGLDLSACLAQSNTYVFEKPVRMVALSDADVKAAPKIDSPTRLTVPQGMEVELLFTEGEFYKVTVDSVQGYIHYVFFDGDYHTFKSRYYPIKLLGVPTVGDSLEWFGKVGPFAEVQTSPIPTAPTLLNLTANSIIKVKLFNKDYWEVNINGKRGYLREHRITNVGKTAASLSETTTTNSSSSGSSYSSPSTMYSTPTTGAPIHTGPRGGRFYYNSRGNKTYIRRK